MLLAVLATIESLEKHHTSLSQKKSILYNKDATKITKCNDQGRDYTPIPKLDPRDRLTSLDLATKKDENSTQLRNLG
jgi:hypothetical protein